MAPFALVGHTNPKWKGKGEWNEGMGAYGHWGALGQMMGGRDEGELGQDYQNN